MAALVVLLLLGALLLLGRYIWLEEQIARACTLRLQAFHRALMRYEAEYGTLPAAAFYPDDPGTEPNSLLVLLDPYGVTAETGVCPGSHPRILAHGLSYIWNASLNGMVSSEIPPDTWMMTGISALSPQMSPPHLGRHITLYADGTVLRTRRPPPIIR